MFRDVIRAISFCMQKIQIIQSFKIICLAIKTLCRRDRNFDCAIFMCVTMEEFFWHNFVVS